MKKIFSLFAAVLFAGSMMADSYVKVTEAPTDWAGDYLIVYEAGNVAFDGSLTTLDDVSNTVAVTISEGAIAATEALNAAKFTIAKVDGGYSLQAASGKFIGITSNSNGLKAADAVGNYTHDLSIDESGNAVIKANFEGSTMTLRYNKASNQARFRYYKSGQEPVALYKFAAGGDTPPEPKEEFYLTGSFRSWATTADANYKFAATATEGEYSLEAEFDAEITCKAIGLKEGADVKWYPDGMGNDLALEAGEYTIYLRPAGNAGEGWHEGVLKAEKKAAPVLPDPTNCAEAAEAALSVEKNNDLYNDGKVYTITGFVTEIAFAWQDGSMSFWMADTKDGGKVLEAYKCAIADKADAVRVGDKVAVTGSLTKYNTTPEFAQGCTVEMIEREKIEEFYLTGSFRSWATTADANYKFAATATEGEYALEATFDAEVTCKAIGLKEGADVKWYPDGMGNDLALEAGEYTIYLRPAGNAGEGWHEGVLKAVKNVPVSCADIYSLTKGDKVKLNEVVVTYANGKNVYVKDESGAMLIFLPSASTDFAAGDVLSGVEGVLDIYNGLYELKPSADQVAAIAKTAGVAPEPEVFTVAPLAADMNKYIAVNGVTVAAGEFTTASATNLNLTIGDETVVLRNSFKLAYTFEEGKKYDVVAVGAVFNSTVQMYFISAKVATGTAVDNATVAGKAQKMIIDGQLFIIRDGVMFNANGAAVK